MTHLKSYPKTHVTILINSHNPFSLSKISWFSGKYHPEKHGGGHGQGNQGSFTSSQTSQSSFSSSQSGFGAANHQGTFNANTGYRY